MIQSKNCAASAEVGGKTVLQLGADCFGSLRQSMLIDTALEAELVSVFFAKLYDIISADFPILGRGNRMIKGGSGIVALFLISFVCRPIRSIERVISGVSSKT